MRQTNQITYFVVGALTVVVVVLGYLYYQERQRSAEFRIELNESGIEFQGGN